MKSLDEISSDQARRLKLKESGELIPLVCDRRHGLFVFTNRPCPMILPQCSVFLYIGGGGDDP
jgi:hypothetical protein